MLYQLEWTENGVQKYKQLNGRKELEQFALQNGVDIFGHHEESLFKTLKRKLTGDYNCIPT